MTEKETNPAPRFGDLRHDSSLTVLLDDRVTQGGVARYGRDLRTGLAEVTDVDVSSYSGSVGAIHGAASNAFTPWGRLLVGIRARRSGFDIVHGLHLELPTGFSPSVVTIHDLIPLQHRPSMPNPLRRATFERIVRSSVQRAAAVIVPSHATKEALASVASSAKTFVVPHGVSETFDPLTEPEKAEARDRFGAGRSYVATIAAGKSHKNMPGLVEAGRLLVGDGVQIVSAGTYSLPSPIRSVGFLPDRDLRLFLGGAEALLSVSLLEGFGLPALEALACATPVVCGPGMSALSWIASGALVVDVLDPRAVAANVVSLLGDDRRRVEMARAGLAVAGELTVAKMAVRTAAIYRQVADASV